MMSCRSGQHTRTALKQTTNHNRTAARVHRITKSHRKAVNIIIPQAQ